MPLAFLGGKPPDAAAVWKHAAADSRAAVADWVGVAGKQFRLKSRGGQRVVGENASERGDFVFSVPQHEQVWPLLEPPG